MVENKDFCENQILKSAQRLTKRANRQLVPLTALVVACCCSPAWAAPRREPSSAAPSKEIVIDAVIASVDEKPITLSELSSRLVPPRKVSLQELAHDTDAQKALEAMTFERILEAEATIKRVSVVDAEVEDYVNEVASRNSLSRAQFESVLSKEGKSIEWYRRQVRTDILRTKLASTIMRGGMSVSDNEIDEYLKNQPSLKHEGASLKLRDIAVSSVGRSPEEVQARVQEILDALSRGEQFSDVAKRMSDGPNREDGGLLGIVAEKDLSSDVFDAVLAVEEGAHSGAIVSGDSTHIFFVEQRLAARDGDEDEPDEETQKALREEARAAIQKQKTDEKLATYFSTELFKNHSVDKKF